MQMCHPFLCYIATKYLSFTYQICIMILLHKPEGCIEIASRGWMCNGSKSSRGRSPRDDGSIAHSPEGSNFNASRGLMKQNYCLIVYNMWKYAFKVTKSNKHDEIWKKEFVQWKCTLFALGLFRAMKMHAFCPRANFNARVHWLFALGLFWCNENARFLP